MNTDLIGIGLYSIPEASRLTGIHKANIARWMFGNNSTMPLWQPQVSDLSLRTIGFRDLIELRFINYFSSHGVDLRVIRAAAKEVKRLENSDYPFTINKYRTDGKQIFEESEDQYGNTIYLDLCKRQIVINAVIEPSLYGVELDGTIATKWYPVKGNNSVVINPDFSFGKPIVEQYGVPTSVLYDSYLVEGDIAFVAQIFEVTENAVQDSIKYEESLLHIAA